MKRGAKAKKSDNRYRALVEDVFFAKRTSLGATVVQFERDDLEAAAKRLKIDLPKNLGDVIYSFRYRTSLPESMTSLLPSGMEWIIEGMGKAKYAFKMAKVHRIVPNPDLAVIDIPDATPEIVRRYALSDEQALLAVVRYNRLIDVFLGIATYSLQNHLRTTVRDIGQIEVDEVYVGVDKAGNRYVVPVQAKGGSDQLSPVQTRQDIACCAEKFPELACRAISTQFMENDVVAVFELIVQDDEVRIRDERHYRLVQLNRE